MLFGFVTSLFTAYYYHQQSFIDTFMAELQVLLMYLMLFVLIKWDVNKLEILKIVLIFAFLGVVMYVLNRITYPTMLFGGESEEEADYTRGALRIGVPFLHCIVLLFFYSINRWTNSKKSRWLAFIVLSYSIICATLTRQTIALSTVLGILLYLKDLSLSKKIIAGVLVIGAMVFFLPKIDFVQDMTEQTQREMATAGENREYVRITEFFLYTGEAQEGIATHLLGNGWSHPGTKYGDEMDYYQFDLALWLVDLGWIGFYYIFGIISAIGLFLLLLSAAVRKKNESEHFVSYWFIYIILTTIVNAPILFPKEVIIIVAMLYFTFGQSNSRIPESAYQKLI